jgi:hypothetical protein
MERLRDFLSSAFGFIRQTKETYDAGSRFMRMRVWIFSLLGADVLVTIMFVLFSGGRALDVDVWFEPGFPANILVVRNEEGDPLPNATLVLDGRYRLTVDQIERGANGYEVNRVFRDSQDASPPDSYKPQQLEIWVDDDSFSFAIGTKQDGS